MSWPHHRRTLAGRLSRSAVLVIAGWLVLLSIGFDLVLDSRVRSQVDDELRVRAQAASATVQVVDGRPTGVRESATDALLDSSIWVFAGDRAVKRPGASERVQRAVDRRATRPQQFFTTAGRRFYVLPIRSAGRRVGTIVASIDTEPFEETQHLAVLAAAVLAGLLLVVAYPVMRFVTGRALLPVARMTRQAAEWSMRAPGARFGSQQRDAELRSLAATLDDLLNRLGAVLRHERQLSAELSHELRTPLSRMSAELELLSEQAPAAMQRPLGAVRADCAAMDSIIETLLAAARRELVPAVGHADLREVLDFFADEEATPAVSADGHGLGVGVAPDVARRIIAPIVDNARRYARTRVEISARRRGNVVDVIVANDGPRLGDEGDRVFEPGYTTSDGTGHRGAGLGLPLARRLARAADGDVTIDDSAAGTAFVVSLPSG